MAKDIPPTHIKIACEATKEQVTVLMGEDVPRITGGYGNFDIIERPRKIGFIEYQGHQPLTMEAELVFDVWGWELSDQARTNNVNEPLKILEKMASPFGGKNSPPPIVTVTGKSVPREVSTPWVIQNITWGSTVRNTQGDILRQTCQVTFLQADTLEHGRKPGNPTVVRNPPQSSVKTYTWKKGDTWPKVAQKTMGDKKYALRIIRFNKLRPGHKMKAGDKVRIPSVPDK